MSKRDVVVLGAARSAIGTFNGALADIEPAELAGTVMKEAVKRSGVDPKVINYVTVGNTIPTESRSAYVARVASIQSRTPNLRVSQPAMPTWSGCMCVTITRDSVR